MISQVKKNKRAKENLKFILNHFVNKHLETYISDDSKDGNGRIYIVILNSFVAPFLVLSSDIQMSWGGGGRHIQTYTCVSLSYISVYSFDQTRAANAIFFSFFFRNKCRKINYQYIPFRTHEESKRYTKSS